MSNLTILKTSIRNFGNLHSLNDLHIASGGKDKHKPAFFLRNDQTKELIEAIKAEGENEPVKVIRGTQGGTYACEELVIAYAMWISPKFHLVVLRAFLAMHKWQAKPQAVALPRPETVEIDYNTLDALVKHSRLARCLAEKTEKFHRTLFEQLGLDPYHRNEIAALSHDVAREFNAWIRRAEEILQRRAQRKAQRLLF